MRNVRGERGRRPPVRTGLGLLAIAAWLGGCVTPRLPAATPAAPAPALAVALRTLAGRILVPPTLISNNAGTLISNNAGALIANNAGALVGNNSAGYRLQALEERAVAGALVDLVDGQGHVRSTLTSDEQGRFRFTELPPDQVFVIRSRYTLAARNFQQQALFRTDASRPATADVTMASTLVTAKIIQQVGDKTLQQLDFAKVEELQVAVQQFIQTLEIKALPTPSPQPSATSSTLPTPSPTPSPGSGINWETVLGGAMETPQGGSSAFDLVAAGQPAITRTMQEAIAGIPPLSGGFGN